MTALLNSLKTSTNYSITENGALTHKSTMSDLYDLYAMGGAYRERTDSDCILLFKNALEENEVYALKCLFYLRNIRGGQGERRFFRVCLKWLAKIHPDMVIRNIENIPLFGRWDDLYELYGTKCWSAAIKLIHDQLQLDVQSKTPSLLGKWLKSENTSSLESKRLGKATREALTLTPRNYRLMLSSLRKKINIVERLMSQGEWDKIEFDKLPSQAGLRYRNAFARNDITKAKYEAFANSKSTKVNAGSLAPYEVVEKAIKLMGCDGWYHSSKKVALDNTERLMINKYWENLTDYFNGTTLNALCVVDTSGSMQGTPINVATALGLYCAERAGGPFANHYISFSSKPQLIETRGVDFCDKVDRIVRTNLCENTNIEATFDLILNTSLKNHLTQDDLPENILVISDMEFDQARGYMSWRGRSGLDKNTLMENISAKWERNGYHMPKLVFWNVNARNNNIPMDARNELITFVSGFSASTFAQILTGKTGYDLMMETLNNRMYDCVR